MDLLTKTETPSAITRFFYRPVHIYPLALFRIIFGALMVLQSIKYFYLDIIQKEYVAPLVHFKWVTWLPELPGMANYIPFTLILISAIGITLGYKFRLSSITFTVSYTYIFLIEMAGYTNHFYFILLMSFLLSLTNAHACWSFDVAQKRQIWSGYIPNWQLFILKLQVFVLYFYGGVSKFHPDWISGTVMRLKLEQFTGHSLFNPLLNNQPAALFFSYTGLIFDLFIGFLLFSKKWRYLGIYLCLFFHAFNYYILYALPLTKANIGIFPLLGAGLTLLFIDSKLPLRWIEQAQKGLNKLIVVTFNKKMKQVDPHNIILMEDPNPAPALMPYTPYQKYAVTGFIFIFFAIQFGVPLRRYFSPGDHLWTRQGHYFGWTMKLTTYKFKDIAVIINDRDLSKRVEVNHKDFITYKQFRKLASNPGMIVQYARFIEDYYRHIMNYPTVSIRVITQIEVNGTPKQNLVDPYADFTKVVYHPFRKNHWILQRQKYISEETVVKPPAEKPKHVLDFLKHPALIPPGQGPENDR